jgi:cysteine dioxygenase
MTCGAHWTEYRLANGNALAQGGAMHGRQALLDLFGCWDQRSVPIALDELLVSLKAIKLDRTDLAGSLIFDDRAYRRIAIHRRPHYQALVLCWLTGQSSPIHDHVGSSCAVRVVEGRASETRYQTTPCGRLVPTRSHMIPAGSVTGCRGDGIHQMANLEQPGSELITLHVYSPPPSGWRYYPIELTTLADNDRLIRERPATQIVDLGHEVPGAPLGRKARGKSPWKA